MIVFTAIFTEECRIAGHSMTAVFIARSIEVKNMRNKFVFEGGF